MNKKYFCSTCNIGFDGKTHYDRHIETDKHIKLSQCTENNTTLEYMNEHENLKKRIIELEKQLYAYELKMDVMERWHKQLTNKLQPVVLQHESNKNYHKCIEPINKMLKETNIDKVFQQIKDIEHVDDLDNTDFPFSELYWSLMNNEKTIEQEYVNFIKQYITIDDFKIDGRNHPNRFYFFKNETEFYTEVESNQMFEQLISSINKCLIDYGNLIHRVLIDKYDFENRKFFKLTTLGVRNINYESIRDKLIKEKHG